MKFIYIVRASYIELRLFFHKVPLFINTLFFPPMRETLYASRVKLFAQASKPLMHVCSGRRRPQNGVVGMHPSWGQKYRSRKGVKIGIVGSTP
jgi:hypothetical protein